MNDIVKVLCAILNELKKITADYVEVSGNTIAKAKKSDDSPVPAAHENPYRTSVILYNASASTMYIGLTKDINSGKYALAISGKDSMELAANNYPSLYKQELWVFWESGAASGSKCMVTEFYKDPQY